MQITEHIYSTHILEDQSTFGAMHPGGTQIYFVGDPDGDMVLVDSGEPYRHWTRQILDYYEELGRPHISAILITHGHGDHIGGLDRLGEDCVVKLRSRELVWTGRTSADSKEAGQGVALRALFTPGHAEDHVCYYLRADNVLFSGDNILGNSSSSVRDLKQYMESLELMAKQRPAIICPGHGQTIHDGEARIFRYMHHRQEREDQVLAALSGGAETVDDAVTAVYPHNLRKNLRAAAARNVGTHLTKLTEEGRVTENPATYSIN